MSALLVRNAHGKTTDRNHRTRVILKGLSASGRCPDFGDHLNQFIIHNEQIQKDNLRKGGLK